jgi:class 3 adenylate cyclase
MIKDFHQEILQFLIDLQPNDFADTPQEYRFIKFQLLVCSRLRTKLNSDKTSKPEFQTSIFKLDENTSFHVHFINSIISEEEYKSRIQSKEHCIFLNFVEAKSISINTLDKLSKRKNQETFILNENSSKCFVLKNGPTKNCKFLGNKDEIVPALKEEPPFGKVTFVLTDIVGRCKIWNKDHFAMKKIISIYFEMIRSAAKDGYEVKTIGDACFFAFKDVQKALKFCLHTQEMFEKKNWKEDLKDFEKLRGFKLLNKMALKFGEYDSVEMNELTGRVDYFGRDINLLSRIIDKCNGGLIITDEETFSVFKMDVESVKMEKIPIRGFQDLKILHLIKSKSSSAKFPEKLKVDDDDKFEFLMKQIEQLKQIIETQNEIIQRQNETIKRQSERIEQLEKK